MIRRRQSRKLGGEREEEDEEKGEWSRHLQLNGKGSVTASNQQLKYICHQCGHETTHSLLLRKEEEAKKVDIEQRR